VRQHAASWICITFFFKAETAQCRLAGATGRPGATTTHPPQPLASGLLEALSVDGFDGCSGHVRSHRLARVVFSTSTREQFMEKASAKEECRMETLSGHPSRRIWPSSHFQNSPFKNIDFVCVLTTFWINKTETAVGDLLFHRAFSKQMAVHIDIGEPQFHTFYDVSELHGVCAICFVIKNKAESCNK
jgi:hypothetical protein